MDAFRNRTALITGGGTGVGAAIALALSAERANVCLVGRRADRLESVAAKARKFNGTVACFPADLTMEEDVSGLVRRVTAELQTVDILVHSAGAIERSSIEDASLVDFDRQYRLNVRAPYVLTKCLLPLLRSRNGDIVFINSSSGLTAKPLFAQYDSTKHALRALANSLRDEVNADGVRVLSVYLGRTATEMQARLHEQEGKTYRPELLLQPEEVAEIVLGALRLARNAEVTDVHVRPMKKS